MKLIEKALAIKPINKDNEDEIILEIVKRKCPEDYGIPFRGCMLDDDTRIISCMMCWLQEA